MPENGIPELSEIVRTIASTHSNALEMKYIPVVFCFAIHLDKIVSVYINRMLLHTFLPTKGHISKKSYVRSYKIFVRSCKKFKTILQDLIRLSKMQIRFYFCKICLIRSYKKLKHLVRSYIFLIRSC